MESVKIDVRQGRLLVISVAAVLAAEDVSRYLAAMEALLDTGRPFAMLTQYRDGRPHKDGDGHRLEKEWLQLQRPRLRGRLVAVALVHRAGPVRRAVERIAMSGAGKRMFGCPCRPFADLDEAASWAASLVDAEAQRRGVFPS